MKKEDIDYLVSIGYKAHEPKEIEYAINKIAVMEITDTHIKKGCKTRKCKWARAIKAVGRADFLNGMGRATYHADAMRESEDGRYKVFFKVRFWE